MTLPPWLRIALGMFVAAYGANLFAPLLPVMRDVHDLGQAPVNLILAVYVLGLIPALMIGGPLSDRRGRRTAVRPAMLFSVVGTAVTLAAHLAAGPVLLTVGRMLTGIAVGLVLAAGASWLKEVTPADAGTGAAARRATVATSAGFGIGPLVSGPVAQWLPGPDTTPLLIHLVMAILVTPLVWATPEPDHEPVDARLRFPPTARSPRFLFSVAVWAPWAFGCATTTFAVLPPLVTAGVPAPVAYTGAIAAVAMLTGTFVQPWAGRLPVDGKFPPAVYALGTAAVGMLGAVLVTVTGAPVLLVPVAVVLGTAYGIMMVSGLREVQRIAAPGELGALTGVFYALTYLGFFVPFIIALVAPVTGYVPVFAVGAVVCLGSMVVTTRHSHPF